MSTAGVNRLRDLLNRRLSDCLWWLIERELTRWEAGGHAPQFWWRDDDARRPSPALIRILDLSQAHQIPLTLAVIPDGELWTIADAIRDRPLVRVIQHGCDHIDRNVGGGFSAEFHPAAPADEIADRINDRWRHLSGALPAVPVYAPPWNVLTANAGRALENTPLRAVSVYGAAGGSPTQLREINTHIDIMLWRPARFRGEIEILRRVLRQLRQRRRAGRWREPIGLLTHHKNLDEPAWRFLDLFLLRMRSTRTPPPWRSIDTLVADS